MENQKIQKNLVYLTESITNLSQVLAYLIQEDVISSNEKEIIEAEKTTRDKNCKLLSLIEKKDWNRVGNLFLEILLKTNNKDCADKIQGIAIPISSEARNPLLHPKIKSKWWPDDKPLIKSLHKRNFGSRLLVKELHERILNDENRMIVLCESEDAAKLTGMGGVGKTLTAKWYAHHYNEEYDHILWMDCGEDSLLNSFKMLARDLDVTSRNEFQAVEEFSRKCFQILCQFKCLWIYDNAERYHGEEGIFKVLPKAKENFFCLITSRSRQWGIENIGHGKISDLQLEIFSQQESLHFLEENIDEKISRTGYQLKNLCGLMGNLPLALQLAVAALNTGEINLQGYIEKTSVEDSGKIVETQFDDYEKTINKNIKISLELIRNEKKNGKLALNILMAFGYIRPDNVTSKLFLTILKSKAEVVKEAVEILEKYSLVTRTGQISELVNDSGLLNKILKRDKKVEMDLLSIHRLLQQVIRHNGKNKERKTLKKILGCEGFIDYKFIPFTKYADEKLQKKFPKVKRKLLDQGQLQKLFREKRFDDAVELVKFIDQELKTKTTKFNYAICLLRTGQTEECLKIAEKLLIKRNESNTLIPLVEELFKYSHKMKVKTGCYCPTICTTEATELAVGSVLLHCYLCLGNYAQALTIAKQIATDAEALIQILTVTEITNYHVQVKGKEVELNLEVALKSIELKDCCLSLDSFDRLSPEELTLNGVSFFRDGQELEEMKINEFLDLIKIKRLTITYQFKKNNVSLDLNEDVSMEFLELNRVKVLNWINSNWSVKTLHVLNIPFVERTIMKVQEMAFCFSSLDVSCLPQTIKKITLWNMNQVFVSGGVELPNLTHLTLITMPDVGCLFNFRSAPLTHLECIGGEVNVDLLPPSLSYLQITNDNTCIVGGLTTVDKLILIDFSFKEVEECLSHLHTHNLLIHSITSIIGEGFLELMNKNIKAIAIGEIKWDNEDFNNYSSQLDRQAEFYFMQGGRCKAIERIEFEELMTDDIF